MRSNTRALTGPPVLALTVLLLLSSPLSSSASLLDGDWSLQTLMDDLVHLLEGDDENGAPPEKTEQATAGADPNGGSEPSEDNEG